MDTIKFEKVDYAEFERAFKDLYGEDAAEEDMIFKIYESIKLPERGTNGSAGYDFFAPFDILVKAKSSITIPTGIRCFMPDDNVLLLLPRSGHGFKYRLQLANTVGVIDSDYTGAKNQGHIMVKLDYTGFEENIKPKNFYVKDDKGFSYMDVLRSTIENPLLSIEFQKAFCQGIIVNYNTTNNDSNNEKHDRIGGFGSTDNN